MIDSHVKIQQVKMMENLRTKSGIRGKIIILDDDKELSLAGRVQNGRISNRIMPIFEKFKMNEDVLHFVTFKDLQEAVERGYLSTSGNLFVLDSTLTEDEHEYSFEQTVPWLVSAGIKPRFLMPGSGGLESFHNNQIFVDKIENMGYSVGAKQENIALYGLTGDIDNYLSRYLDVVEGIIDYANELRIADFSNQLDEVRSEISQVKNIEGKGLSSEDLVPLR
jgi:hypothetical protein